MVRRFFFCLFHDHTDFSTLDRGHNKIIFIFELYIRGFRFAVLPDVFTIHRFEPDEASKKYRKYMRAHPTLYHSLQEQLRRRYRCWPGAGMCGETRPDFFILSNKD